MVASEAHQVPPSQDLATELLATTNATAIAAALDKARRRAHAIQYPKNAWIVVGSIIALVAVCHWVGLLWTYTFARRSQYTSTTAQSSNNTRRSRGSNAIQWSRLPIALTNVFRVVAFRWTIPIGNDHTLNAMEIFLLCAYIAIVYTWAFVNCEYDVLLIDIPSSGPETLESHV
jgi:ferric-chelate reductase